MLVKFIGDPVERELDLPPSTNSIDWFGVSFRRDVPVDVSHLNSEQRAKLAANSHFEVVAEIEGESREIVTPPAAARRKAPAAEQN